MISGRTKICDIDMLLIVGTSSLFNNVMQTVDELMTLLPLHWANITFGLSICCHTTDGSGSKKKAITGSLWLYKVIYMCMLIDSLSGFWPHFIKWQSSFYLT